MQNLIYLVFNNILDIFFFELDCYFFVFSAKSTEIAER